MNHLRFLKLFIRSNIILHFLTFSNVIGEGFNFQLPLGIENIDEKELEDMVGFNFPKDSVFVFNRPTIINLGDIDNMDVIETLQENGNRPININNRRHRLLCKLNKDYDENCQEYYDYDQKPSTTKTNFVDVSDETTEPRVGELIPEVIDTKTSIELTADSLPEFQTRIISRPRRCNSNPITDMNCCTGGRPCGIGQGDCDYDSDCQYGLKCGTDNCYYDFPTTYGFNWEIMADCCYAPKKVASSKHVPLIHPPTRLPNCGGGGQTDYNCCKQQHPCGVGMGDCDFDSDCLGGLKCGTNNCWTQFRVQNGYNWDIQADCCYDPRTAVRNDIYPRPRLQGEDGETDNRGELQGMEKASKTPACWWVKLVFGIVKTFIQEKQKAQSLKSYEINELVELTNKILDSAKEHQKNRANMCGLRYKYVTGAIHILNLTTQDFPERKDLFCEIITC